jgi:hypothetical protein
MREQAEVTVASLELAAARPCAAGAMRARGRSARPVRFAAARLPSPRALTASRCMLEARLLSQGMHVTSLYETSGALLSAALLEASGATQAGADASPVRAFVQLFLVQVRLRAAHASSCLIPRPSPAGPARGLPPAGGTMGAPRRVPHVRARARACPSQACLIAPARYAALYIGATALLVVLVPQISMWLPDRCPASAHRRENVTRRRVLARNGFRQSLPFNILSARLSWCVQGSCTAYLLPLDLLRRRTVPLKPHTTGGLGFAGKVCHATDSDRAHARMKGYPALSSDSAFPRLRDPVNIVVLLHDALDSSELGGSRTMGLLVDVSGLALPAVTRLRDAAGRGTARTLRPSQHRPPRLRRRTCSLW